MIASPLRLSIVRIVIPAHGLAALTETPMFTLFHHPLCPHSRYVRLILGEYGIAARLVEERFGKGARNFWSHPAAELPVLVSEG